jgi:hypothetical protein
LLILLNFNLGDVTMRKLTYLLCVALLAAMSQAAITYVDAVFTGGSANTLYAPSAGGGSVTTSTGDTVDGLWRARTSLGLRPTVTTAPTGLVTLDSASTVYEGTGNTSPSDNVRRVVTTASVAQGAYDVYVYFWMDQNGSPWRIRAGLVDTVSPLTLFTGSNTFTSSTTPISWIAYDTAATPYGRRLLQAYLGQTSGSSISVFVEDGPATSGIERTWYDGIGYVKAYNIPNSPSVTPVNGNGTVGTLVNGDTQAEVTLHFNAGADPNYPVNPKIKKHYIYISAPNDPNIPTAPTATINQVHNADPMLTDPANSYGPIVLNRSSTYYWRVEEAINDPNGVIYPAGNPNNYVGAVWSFTTISPQCTISAVTPQLAAVPAGSNAVMNVTGTNVVGYQWYKIGTPDIQLTNGVKYSGVDTATLTIIGAQLADEGLYYCIASNTISTASNRDTGPGRVMIQRLTNHYPMEVINGTTTPDVVGGVDMTLHTNGTVMPVLVSGVVGSSGLSLDTVAEPTGQYGQLAAGVLDYNDCTLTAWVYWKGGAGFQRIFDFGNDTTQYITLTPNANGSSATFTVMNTSEEGVQTYSQQLPSNQWVHVAVSLNGNTGRLYVNGRMMAKNTGMTHDPINFRPALNYIGKSLSATEPYLNGMIDDLKIYNYALSNTEVAQEYIAVMGGWICDAEGTDPMRYDFNGDCRVDLADFARFAADWLGDNRIN